MTKSFISPIVEILINCFLWSEDNNETLDIIVLFHLEDITGFHIDNQICNLTSCLTIQKNENQHNDYWKDCMDFFWDEISDRISVRTISIVSVEPYKE